MSETSSQPDSAGATHLGAILDPLMITVYTRVLVNGTNTVRDDVLELLMNHLSASELVGFLDGPFRRNADKNDFPKEKIDAAIDWVRIESERAKCRMRQGILFT